MINKVYFNPLDCAQSMLAFSFALINNMRMVTINKKLYEIWFLLS